MARRTLKNLIEDFVRFRLGNPPSDRQGTPLVDPKDEVVNRLDASTINSASQLQEFRTLAEDRNTQYNTYDEMKTDSVIAAALELYADDSTQYDEQGRVVWIESEDETIVEAGTRLLDIFEIPERAWKHIYQACLYGDYYLKLHRYDEMKRSELEGGAQDIDEKIGTVRIVNDEKRTKETHQPNTYVEYVEDVADPATVFELRKFGKTAGFVEVSKEDYRNNLAVISNATIKFQMKDISVYQPDRFIHIMLGENMSRDPEEITIDLGDGKEVVYSSARGKSILQDVYPIQRELQLLEDSLLLNRLTRSSLIRILEVEVGSMPKTEVNAYLRRIKNLIEQHIAMDKDEGTYKSFNAPGPIDNVIYVPTRNGKGSISVNNLGGDVNVRDIADIDYFSNKRAGALKIPRSYLGESMDGSGLSNGGSLTRLDIRYARTIKRIQTAYIRAITNLLNLFFIDKNLDYVNKFQVRMTSPSTQEDLERQELIAGNIDLSSSILDLTGSLEGDTQKEVLKYLIDNLLKMPEIGEIIDKDKTPEEEVDIDGGSGGPNIDVDADFGGPEDTGGEETVDMSDEFSEFDSGDNEVEGGFTEDEFSEFEDEI